MEETISDDRKKLIEDLTKVISRADAFLKEACQYYQWDLKDLEKVSEGNYITCPFDQSHVVPEKSMQKHLESCEWKTLGYTKDCKPLPESTIPIESPFSIKFDMELQYKVLQEAKQKNGFLDIGNEEKLIAQTSDRLTSDFTRDERLAMYEYVTTHTLAPDVGQDIEDLNKPEKKEQRSASLLELLAQERNLKRRKTRYRGVHTNKKSHVEIMREVVQQQMEMYKEYLVEKFGIVIPDENQDNSSNIVKEETLSSSHYEFSSSKRRSRDRSHESHRSKDHSKNHEENSKHHSKDSHRSHTRDYNDRSRESYKHHSRDYSTRSKHSSQYQDRDSRNYSKDSSSRRDYREDDDYNYKSRDKHEDKNYSRRYYDDKSKSSRERNRDYNNSDNNRDSRKRNHSSSVDKETTFKSENNFNNRKNDEDYENSHTKKKHKSSKSHKDHSKKHKKTKHKHRSRSSSQS